jgi:uncharacterized BrkB/YihY/UPF0761 family membrane protein
VTRVRIAQARVEDALARASQRLPWHDVVVRALERERFAAAGLLAGGLAYRLFLWLVPFGLVCAAALSFVVEYDEAGLEKAARKFGLSAAAAGAAAESIEQEAHSAWYFLGAGLVLLAWFGPGVVRALYVAHAVAWRLPPTRPTRPFQAGAVFSGTIAALIVLSTVPAFVRREAPGPGLVCTLALVVAYAGIVVWASSVLPSRATDWRAFVPGAVLVAIGTQAVHLLAIFYLAPKLGRSSELYGTLGASTVVLLWLYLIARLLVGAAFLNAALWERSSHPDEVRADLPREDRVSFPSGT